MAALVLAANSDLSNADARSILQQTAENLGLKQEHQGYGLVMADLAVQAASRSVPTDPDPDPEPDTITVSSISYSLSRNAKHMYVSVQLNPAVASASVSIEVYLNEGSSPYYSGTITIDTAGVAKFTLVNAPSSTYSTVVTDVTPAGYTLDGDFPEDICSK